MAKTAKAQPKDKYDVILLTMAMRDAEGESRIEKVRNALNKMDGTIRATFEFKGEVYIAVEK